MNKPNSTSVTFIREADPPVFLSLPRLLTRPTQRMFLSARAANSARPQPSTFEHASGPGTLLAGDEVVSAAVVASAAPDTPL